MDLINILESNSIFVGLLLLFSLIHIAFLSYKIKKQKTKLANEIILHSEFVKLLDKIQNPKIEPREQTSEDQITTLVSNYSNTINSLSNRNEQLSKALKAKLDLHSDINQKLIKTNSYLEVLSSGNDTNDINNINFNTAYNIDEASMSLLYADNESTITNLKGIEKSVLNLTEKYKKLHNLEEKERELSESIKKTSLQYIDKLEVYNKLKKEVSLFNEDSLFFEYGVYKPSWDYDSTDEYKSQINKINSKEKELIKSGDHYEVYVTESSGKHRRLYKDELNNSYDWTGKGRASLNSLSKFAIKCFNLECDKIITSCKWDNIKQSIDKIKQLQEKSKTKESYKNLSITLKDTETEWWSRKFNSVFISISDEYVNCKIDILKLNHELELLKHNKKEENALIRVQLKEQARVEAEYKKAIDKAERAEQKLQLELKTAELKKVDSSGIQLQKLEEKIIKLNAEIEMYQQDKARALSMAEQTKKGFVYVISNIGTMGDNIVKIGMSRRLDPMERIRELGNASVPFKFDVHAMIYTDDAPTLEKELHSKFDKNRINLTNKRKEFFRASLDDIESVIQDIHDPSFKINKDIKAQEYFESTFLREREMKNGLPEVNQCDYPDSI